MIMSKLVNNQAGLTVLYYPNRSILDIVHKSATELMKHQEDRDPGVCLRRGMKPLYYGISPPWTSNGPPETIVAL